MIVFLMPILLIISILLFVCGTSSDAYAIATAIIICDAIITILYFVFMKKNKEYAVSMLRYHKTVNGLTIKEGKEDDAIKELSKFRPFQNIIFSGIMIMLGIFIFLTLGSSAGHLFRNIIISLASLGAYTLIVIVSLFFTND